MGERDHDDAGDAGRRAAGEGPAGAAHGPAGAADVPAADGPAGARRRRALLVAALVAAVAVVAVVLALTARDRGASAGPVTSGATPTVTAPTTTSPAVPSGTASSAPDAPPPGPATADPAAPGSVPPAADAPVPVPPLGDVAPVVGSGTAPVDAAGLTVAVTGVEAVRTQAEGVGEVAAPGVALTVEVRGPAGRRLDAAAVSAHAGAEGAPLRPAESDERNAPLPAQLPGDGVARGTYVFAAPAPGTPLALTVLLRLDVPPVVVQGLLAP
ncbi:hypothetical protein GC089_14200 [Cellulomonas sp. JZ18]|uniref:hypothetical protein n=1 Tax=Cellulomonas sp. JZ18 TaxID=2654191 RepID=UPI0012D3DFCB|nr:hypothetical protein [Cellulomonas sp. JZ18]QGQ20149.1 hypothetical protein GC089_14200 [Cellulomonas sp. JZ18]